MYVYIWNALECGLFCLVLVFWLLFCFCLVLCLFLGFFRGRGCNKLQKKIIRLKIEIVNGRNIYVCSTLYIVHSYTDLIWLKMYHISHVFSVDMVHKWFYINFDHQRAFHERCMRPLRLTLLDFSQIDIFAIMVMTVIHILTTAHSFQLYIYII